jgi:hypothetical protein
MKLATTRRMTPFVLLTAALLALSPAAIAVPPEKGDPVPNHLIWTRDRPVKTSLCGLREPIRTRPSEYKDRKGEVVRILQTGGGYTLTYTNLDTMESVTIRPTGSNRRIVTNADGTFTVTGTAGIILFPSDTPKALSSTQYYGRLVYTLEADGGTFKSLDTTGTSRDICAELA